MGLGFGEVAASTFLLDQQDALPKQVDKAAPVAEQCNGLFKRGNPTHGNAEEVEKVAVEKLSLPLLVARALPFLGESGGAGADFIIGQSHRGHYLLGVVYFVGRTSLPLKELQIGK